MEYEIEMYMCDVMKKVTVRCAPKCGNSEFLFEPKHVFSVAMSNCSTAMVCVCVRRLFLNLLSEDDLHTRF